MTDKTPPVAVTIALEAACVAHSTQRVGQVIANALGSDPYYMTNAEARDKLFEYSRKAL